MRSTETVALAVNVSGASTVTKPCVGGRYLVLPHGTLGTGPKVEVQDPAGNWYAVASLTTDTPQEIAIPSGQVRANLASGAANAYVYLSRVPND